MTATACLSGERLDDATVLVTGASDGIGRETALALGRRGATVLVHGRDEAKTAAVVDAVDRTDGEGVGPLLADFLDLDAVRDLADDAADRGVDVLVNNAGASFGEGERSPAGVERTVHVNHLGPWVLTSRLLPTLRESDGPTGADEAGRVVVVGSEAHRGVALDLDAAESVDDYDQMTAYRRSKLANLMFAFELARRESEVAVNVTHPGFVPGSELWRDVSLPVRLAIGLARRFPEPVRPGFIKDPSDGAAPSVYLAGARETADWAGAYVTGCRRIDAADAATDRDAQRRLWAWSASVTDEEPPVDASDPVPAE